MSPKRRGGQAKTANPAPKVAPTPSTSKSAPPPPVPVQPPPPPPPPQPVEAGAAKVRKEWSKFIDAWYEPQKKKFVEKLQKELLVKYKNLGSAKETQKLREMELYEKLDSIAEQLAKPARAEWERRLDLAQVCEDQWDDMTGEEQQEVMSVFVGFVDDLEDFDDGDASADPSSVEEEESILEESQHRGTPAYAPAHGSAPSRQPIPPTPSRTNFEFVNASFFTESTTPPNSSKNLPALSMDHLATLGPSNAARSAEPASASVGGALGFHHWASEAGIITQQPQGQSPKPQTASMSAQTLSARPRATDNMSRQASAASNLSSPPMKTSSPQYSPPNISTKFSPQTNAENLPLGKRYIGPIITEEEPDPLDEELLKSKMADEYQQYKISLRIQMIYQFHAEAAEVEIKLFETLLSGDGTKESRARAVQEHETSMMRLREQKEEERKRLCAEEREKRREEIRQHLAQRRTTQSREIDAGPKGNLPPKPAPDKSPSIQQRLAKATHQKENVPVPPLATASPPVKLEAPTVIKKSISTLSQGDASANEAVFANAMAMMAQGKAGATGLTATQASTNEAVFANAAAMFAAQGQPASGGKGNSLQPPSIVKKSLSSRSQEYDIPQITVSFAETPFVDSEPAQVPLATVKRKKGSKGQPVVQLPPAKSVVITEEPDMEMDAEPPPFAPSLWDAAAVAAKNAWGVASASLDPPGPKAKVNASMEEEWDIDVAPKRAPAPIKGNVNAKKNASAVKKGKKVMIIEEPDVDADPIVSPPPSAKPKATKGGWGSVNGKSKATHPVVQEQEPEPSSPPVVTPVTPITHAWGKKPNQPSTANAKPQLKVTISEEPESEFERVPASSRTNRASAKWGAPVAVPAKTSAPSGPGKKGTSSQVESRRGPPTSGSRKPARVETVPDPEDEDEGEDVAAGDAMAALELVAREEAGSDDEEEGDASAWFNPENMSYWANFMAGQSETETLAAPQAPSSEQPAPQHMLWTPTVSREYDDDDDDNELVEENEELATNMWVQYAISGGDMPGLGDAPQEVHVDTTPSESVQRDAGHRIWEQAKGKKKLNTTGDVGNRAQQASVFDRAALTGQWPKMESWLSPPARGQSSGSARVF